MSAVAATVRSELIGLGGIVERNIYLTKRYFLWDLAFMVWTIANTLTIVFIARAVHLAAGEGERARDEPARRRRDLGVPRDHLRVRDGDGRVGALGRNDRVHVHGAAVALDAPLRHGRVRRALRARPRDDPVLRRRGVHRHPHAGRELRGGVRAALHRVVLVHRDRDDDVGAAADLAGEGRAARLRHAGNDARRLRRLLPRVRDAGVDAVDLEDLARDVRAARLPRVDHRRRAAALGRTSGRS